MSLEEKNEIIKANEDLIEKFEKEALEARTDADEYTALGMLQMITERNEQFVLKCL